MAVVLSRRLVLSLVASDYSLDYPRACFENLLIGAAMDASTTESNEYPVENMTDGYTYDYWRPSTMPAWARGVLPIAQDVDFVGIAAHTLGSAGCTFVTQYYDGASWVDCHDPITPIDDSVVMVFFDSVFSNQYRLYITGGSAPSIGVLFVGASFVFPQKVYVGHTPETMARVTKIKMNMSDEGYDLGRTIMRDGIKGKIEFKHLSAAWVRSQLSPALDVIDTSAFFFAWRPGTYPTEVAYVWTQGDRPTPVNTGPGDMMSVAFNIRGMVGESGSQGGLPPPEIPS